MYRLLGLSRRASAALVLGFGLSFAAQAQPAPRGADLGARLDRLAERLDLSTDQRAELDALAARNGEATPADLWTVTADVHGLLTPEQRAVLTAPRAEGERRTRGEGERRARGRRGQNGRRGDGAGRSRGDRAERSDADRQARRAERETRRETMQPIQEAARAERQALREQLQNGALSDEAYGEAVRALRERTEAQVRAAATPEQRARLDERDARRQASKMARDRVLGLTDAQKQQLDALRAARVRQAPERDLDLRPYLDDEGRLDRDALREARRAEQPEREAARQAARAQRDDVLTERQQELLAVHRALAGRADRGHRRGGGHRGGGRRG